MQWGAMGRLLQVAQGGAHACWRRARCAGVMTYQVVASITRHPSPITRVHGPPFTEPNLL